MAVLVELGRDKITGCLVLNNGGMKISVPSLSFFIASRKNLYGVVPSEEDVSLALEEALKLPEVRNYSYF